MEELPEAVDGIAKWCQDIFVAKVYHSVTVENIVCYMLRGCWRIKYLHKTIKSKFPWMEGQNVD